MLKLPLGRTGLCAVVDDEDHELAQHKWHARFPRKNGTTIYAYRWVGREYVLMHRVVAGARGPTQHVDHLDHDGLNNRRENLRIVTAAQNRRNLRRESRTSASGRVGIHLLPNGRWHASIIVDRRHKSLGCYATMEEAETARLDGERLYWGAAAPVEKTAHAILVGRRKVHKNSPTGVPGVGRHSNGRDWVARTGGGKTRRHVGTFKTFEEAVAARKAAEKLL
jgi:hypothetical protein